MNTDNTIQLMNRLAMLTLAAVDQMDKIEKMLDRLNAISAELGTAMTIATDMLTAASADRTPETSAHKAGCLKS